MNLKKTASFVLLAAISTSSHSSNIDLEVGMCGPAKSMHNLLSSAGYVLLDPFFVIHGKHGLMSYFPTAERIISQRLKNEIVPGLQRIEVVHEDASESLPGGRRCIRHIGFMTASEVDNLKDYLNRVSPMLYRSEQK